MYRLTLNYFRILFLATALPTLRGVFLFIPEQIGGIVLTAWAWITVLLVSIIYLFRIKKSTFPIMIWLPWFLFLTIYLLLDFSILGFQLTVQYMVSILVGWVSSGLNYNRSIFDKITKWFIFLILLVCFDLIYFFVRTFGLPDISFGAAEVMTINVAASLALSVYFVRRNPKAMNIFFVLLIFPVIQVTRMGIMMMLSIAPLHFGNTKMRNKLLIGVILVLVGILVFNSSTFQKKTFFSGKGSLTELIGYEENDNFDTSGRKEMYNMVKNGIKLKPLLGHGPRADLQLMEQGGFKVKEVHNDYLSVEYNYGKVGLCVLMFCFFWQFGHLYSIRNRSKIAIFKIAIFSALTLFIPLFGFMYSDNVLKYSIYFGNFHFALMGISYALINKKKNANISNNTSV